MRRCRLRLHIKGAHGGCPWISYIGKAPVQMERNTVSAAHEALRAAHEALQAETAYQGCTWWVPMDILHRQSPCADGEEHSERCARGAAGGA